MIPMVVVGWWKLDDVGWCWSVLVWGLKRGSAFWGDEGLKKGGAENKHVPLWKYAPDLTSMVKVRRLESCPSRPSAKAAVPR